MDALRLPVVSSAPRALDAESLGLTARADARAQVVDLRLEPTPLLVGAHQLVEDLLAALARDRRPDGVRVRAGGPEVNHAVESK